MPGLLRPDAVCPRCGDPLEVLIDTENREGIQREYHHAKPHPKSRRKKFCKAFFAVRDIEWGRKERRELEVAR